MGPKIKYSQRKVQPSPPRYERAVFPAITASSTSNVTTPSGPHSQPIISLPVTLRLPSEVHQQPSENPIQPQEAEAVAEPASWVTTSSGAAFQIVDDIMEEDDEDTEIPQSPSEGEEEAAPFVHTAANILRTETDSTKESLASSLIFIQA